MHGVPNGVWLVFGVVMLAGLVLDLFSHRGERADSHRSAVGWAIFWVAVGLLFGLYVHFALGSRATGEYYAAYLIEKSLSVDNLFVFLIIFQTLNIATEYQRTVLSWGIFGALIFRALFIFLGAAAIERWHWVSYVFGAILVYAAYQIFKEDPGEKEENKAVIWLSRHVPLTHELHGHRFFSVENGRRVATPLLVAVLGLEVTDIMFAIDSVPAAFAVSTDRFILYSSNAFAILGLRSLYLVLAKSIADLKYLHYGLAAVLAFAGFKLVSSNWNLHIPAWLSIAIIVLAIGIAVLASLRHARKHPPEPEQLPPGK